MTKNILQLISSQSLSFDDNLIALKDDMPRNHLTVEIDYDRPYFNAPNLNSSYGNALVFISTISNFLKNQKFYTEATELEDIFLENKSGFNFIDLSAHFVDFQNHFSVKVIDDETFISKKKLTPKMKQISIFNKINSTNIDNLIKESPDSLLEVNIYGRNILHYINNEDTLIKVLKFFKEEDDIGLLFNIDIFNGTCLLQQKNIKNMHLIMSEMMEVSQDLTYKFFFYENKFNQNASGIFLKSLDSFFYEIKQINQFSNIEEKKEFISSFNDSISNMFILINKLDSNFYNKTLSTFKSSIENLKLNLNSTQEKEIKATLNSLEFHILNNSIDSKSNKTKLKAKI